MHMSLMTGLPVPLAAVPEAVAPARHDGEGSFAALVARFQPLVFRWATALSDDGDDAEDIVQEVFVSVHRTLSGYRGDGPFEGWLYRITRRTAMRARQRNIRRVTRAGESVYLTDPGARIDRQRAVALIRTIAATLPLRQREVFILCDLDGRTPADAAGMLDMKDVSVRASLFKARAAIRRSILATHPFYRESSG